MRYINETAELIAWTVDEKAGADAKPDLGDEEPKDISSFSLALETMSHFHFTPADFAFCNNAQRHPLFIPYRWRQILTKMENVSEQIMTALDHFADHWQPNTVYDKVHKIDIFHITLSDDTSRFQTLALSALDISNCQTLRVNVKFVLDSEELSTLFRYLAEIMSLSRADTLEITSPETPLAHDFTPLLMIANLFCKKLRFCSPINAFFQDDAITKLKNIKAVELLPINDNMSLLIKEVCDRNRNQVFFDLDMDTFPADAPLHEITPLLDKITLIMRHTDFSGVDETLFLKLNVLRVLSIACAYRLSDGNISSEYFMSYLHSITLISILGTLHPEFDLKDFFDKPVVQNDLTDILNSLEKRGESLTEHYNILVHLEKTDTNSLTLLMNSAWLGILKYHVERDLDSNPRRIPHYLSLIKNSLWREIDNSTSQLFLYSCTLLASEQDERHFDTAVETLSTYITSQKNASPNLEEMRKNLFLLLFSKAREGFAGSIYSLCCFAEHLIEVKSTHIVLEALRDTKPTRQADFDNNFFSFLALSGFLIAATGVISMSEIGIDDQQTQFPPYEKRFEDYFNNYIHSILMIFKKSRDSNAAYNLLKLFILASQHSIPTTAFINLIPEALNLALNHMITSFESTSAGMPNYTEEDFQRDEHLLIKIIPRFLSYDLIVKAYIRLQKFPGHFQFRISAHLYSYLLEMRLGNTATHAMLVEMYNLSDPIFSLYLELMNQIGDREFFNRFIDENPEAYCSALLKVYAQFNIYLDADTIPDAFIVKLLNQYFQFLTRQFNNNFSFSISDIPSMLTTSQIQIFKKNFHPENFLSFDTFNSILNIVFFSICTLPKPDPILIERLLLCGADPLYTVNTRCALLLSIRDSTNPVLDIACKPSFKIDISRLYEALSEDPLELAVRSGASLERVELMLSAGFDVSLYNIEEHDSPAHELLCACKQSLMLLPL